MTAFLLRRPDSTDRPTVRSPERFGTRPSTWTLLGREAKVGRTKFVVRSCQLCGVQGYAAATNRAALDELRGWSVRHPSRCPAIAGNYPEVAAYPRAARGSTSPSTLRSSRTVRPKSSR